MPKSDVLEVKIKGKWKQMAVPRAIAINERYGRCVKCKEPARGHKLAANGAAAHVEHLTYNEDCPLSMRKSSRPI